MPRIAWVVVPGYPHQVTQRGNRRANLGLLESAMGRLLYPQKRGPKPCKTRENQEADA